jgi:hypothetical protein
VIGKILVAKKGCTLDPAVTPVTIRKIVFAAPSADSAGDAGSTTTS